MSWIFSRSPFHSSKQEASQLELLQRKFQQCIVSETDFVRNVGFFLEKIKSRDFDSLFRTVDKVKSTIKASKSSDAERFLAILVLKTLLECEEGFEIARYSATKILRRLRIIAEKCFNACEDRKSVV